MGAAAGFLVKEAEVRDPQLTKEKAVQLPIVTDSGKPSEKYHWYYRIDVDLKIFGFDSGKILMIDTEIHNPLKEGLKNNLQ